MLPVKKACNSVAIFAEPNYHDASLKADRVMPISVNKRSPDDLTLSGEIELHGADSPKENGVIERRAKPRLRVPFPSRAWGTDAAGKAFELDCVLDNLSSRGVYFRLPAHVVSGDELSLVVTFVSGADSEAKALLRCKILRTVPQADGHFGIAVAIIKHQFL